MKPVRYVGKFGVYVQSHVLEIVIVNYSVYGLILLM
jgi:hypothetical protein